jgi:hypothetical protein
MNANIPPIDCYVRKEYLYDHEQGHGEFVSCSVFAIKSLQNNALLFSVMTDIGAVYDKIPISALAPYDNPNPEHLPFHVLQLWDCFSYQPHVIEYMFLKGKRCSVLLKDGTKRLGIYKFSVDWSADSSNMVSTSYAEITAEHKTAHIIQLDDGYYCAYPNNRILWAEPSSIDKPFETIPDYKLNTHKYHCESHEKWYTENSGEDSDKFFYQITTNGPDTASNTE